MSSRAEKRIGVQLYTVRTLLERDFEGTIGRIAEIGYREVEPHGFFGRTAAQVRSILDSAGLDAPSRHVPLSDLRSRIGEVAEQSLTLGCRWVVCAFVDASERSLEGYRKVADDLNRAAVTLKDSGLSFAYHNHDFEFERLGDVVPYDLLLERCDDDLVSMELDLYWTAKGGADPLDYFSRYPGRFGLCHVKDMGADGSMADVGAGVLDFKTVFSSAELAGIKHYFVEHDQPQDPLASVTASFAAASTLLGNV